MSLQMATAGVAAHAMAGMPADCPMHTGAQAPETSAHDSSDSTPAPTGGVESCSSCQLCIPLAKLASGSLEAVSFAVHEQPLMPRVAFMSASLAPAVKPPIS
ncbi:hypothetical protein [Piscinibacter sp. HJYY11]|uniref:hypothetical protein n=1 Tax=Piscinibacter sp. HJYY11 TaxID=2801333 RepID=UPI00191EE5BC|nr:hypothetical protein [Piscinibacter sp. HJYY11]MBL0726555.1 hypothetical protein [Piscinibacter sp. HJYY11]